MLTVVVGLLITMERRSREENSTSTFCKTEFEFETTFNRSDFLLCSFNAASVAHILHDPSTIRLLTVVLFRCTSN